MKSSLLFFCFAVSSSKINPIFFKTQSNPHLSLFPLKIINPLLIQTNNDELILESRTESRLKFPRIAIKLRPGQVTVREKETILDEKIIETKEEVVVDPITGEHSVQTFEYVEKTIEKEVCYENIKQKSNE